MELEHQSHEASTRNRMHSLDAYRGVLMLLGIVLHGAIPFMHGGDAVSVGVVKFTFWSVHLFRMPAFFVLCGFFGALLWQRYGAGGMLMNRFERIVLPLVVSLTVALFVILYPVLIAERWYNHSGNIMVDAFDLTIKEIIPVSDPGASGSCIIWCHDPGVAQGSLAREHKGGPMWAIGCRTLSIP